MTSSNSAPFPPDASPNPFSIALSQTGDSKQRFFRAFQFLLIAAVVTAVWLAITFFGQRWLLNRLVSDLPQLAAAEKTERLIQISAFGIDSIEHLTPSLMDVDDAVSEAAFELLSKLQNDWTAIPPEQAVQSHHRLVAGIVRNIRDVPVADWTLRQRARARALVRQTMLEYADVDAISGDSMLVAAAKVGNDSRATLAMLDPPANPTALISSAEIAKRPVTQPSQSQWTDWPPSKQVQILRSGSRDNEPVQVRETATHLPSPEADGGVSTEDAPAKLEPLPNGVTVPLSAVPMASQPAAPTDRANKPEPPSTILRVGASLVDSPFAAMDDESVLRHLGNPDASRAEQARAELLGRGFTKTQLEFGTAIAVAAPADRIMLIDSMLRSGGLNAWPWLSMMLDDSDRSVRLHVVSILAPSKNRTVHQRLEQRLQIESDALVSNRIRKATQQRE